MTKIGGIYWYNDISFCQKKVRERLGATDPSILSWQHAAKTVQYFVLFLKINFRQKQSLNVF